MRLTLATCSLLLLHIACGGASGEQQATAQTTMPAPAPADTTPAAGSPEVGSPEWVRAKIRTFREDPSVLTGAPIVAFAEKSPDVAIVIRSSLSEFEGLDEERTLILLAAFTAGNVEAQLDAGTVKDMPVAGVRMMLTVYAKLEGAAEDLTISKLDAFQSAEQEGRLDAAVYEAIADEAADTR
ncbi:MAG: hypothetical protein KC731_32525 [Myxococcales bacterium]|nr:hypothetical protein [Myxococcales bacterium]